MKKLLILMCFICYQLQAQNIELTLLPNSIKIQNDSLYFKYKIQNKSNIILAFYNIRLFDIQLEPNPNIAQNAQRTLPGFLVTILDKNNKLPPILRMTTRHDRHSYEDSIFSRSYNRYIVLKPDESRQYDRILYIGNIGLTNGFYKLQLEYLSNNYYKYKFQKIKKMDKMLKNCVMFNGTIKSNVCSFTYQVYSNQQKKK